MGETTPEADPRKLAEEARDRVRFEEEALDLADQVYRVARRLVSTREEAEDLMQETYARAFRAWRSYTPGTNLRAWLLRILTNLNIDRGRKVQRSPDLQPLEEGDYYLYNRLEEAGREPSADQDRVDERLSTWSRPSRPSRTTSATWSCSWTSATSVTPTRRRSSRSRSAP
jgi:RNA polymerase sigma factor (sigma-70 family)